MIDELSRSRLYRNYALGLLTTLLLCNYLDRVTLGMVLQDIKGDLEVSDTELGLLSGIAFAFFYSIMGIPIARWADRGDRRLVISITALIWSVAVMLCGFVGSFGQLLAVRVAVSVGEAGCIPPALSLIADYFSRAERPRATAIYGLGGSLSALLGYSLAGWIDQRYGWRLAFIMMGAPGVVFGVLSWWTLEEPRRKGRSRGSDVSARECSGHERQPSLMEVGRHLAGTRTFRLLLWALAGMFFFLYGINQWVPSMFIRSYGLSRQAAGVWLAVIIGVGGLTGSLLGGILASRYAPNDERRQLRAVSVSIAMAGVLYGLSYVVPSRNLAFVCLGLAMAGVTAGNGPLFATIQTLVPANMRAIALSVVYLFANLIGMGLGPLATGVVSDSLRSWAGEESLRYSLLLLDPGYLVVAVLVWRAGTSVADDVRSSNSVRVSSPTSAPLNNAVG